jgi:hypothetical protein
MNKLNQHSKSYITLALSILTFSTVAASASQQSMMNVDGALSFKQAIKSAQKFDPWLTGNIHKQKALESMSRAVNNLEDPKVSLGLANLPVNGFDFGQEGMTQAKVAITQMFPRGDTLAIKSQQLQTQSEAFPYQRIDRESKVAVTVGSLWLDAYQMQQSIALIERNKSLFEQLVDVAEVGYASALGKTRQQDVIQAQLELTRLEDRLNLLEQHKSRYHGMLLPWLNDIAITDELISQTSLNTDVTLHNIVVSQQLPEIELINSDLVTKVQGLQPQKLVRYFSHHPSVIALEKKINASKSGIKLAEQKYKAQWGVNASYGYRADDDMGRSRADLFSVGVTFDLPIFTENRQDQELKSAVSTTEAVKTEKVLLLRELLAAFVSAKGRLLRLQDRQTLYREKLLPQIHDQAEASLSAYTNDDGDFSEVVRARIAVLNSEIEQLTLNVEEQKIRLELNYLFMGSLNTTAVQQQMHLNNSNETAIVFGDN